MVWLYMYWVPCVCISDGLIISKINPVHKRSHSMIFFNQGTSNNLDLEIASNVRRSDMTDRTKELTPQCIEQLVVDNNWNEVIFRWTNKN